MAPVFNGSMKMLSEIQTPIAWCQVRLLVDKYETGLNAAYADGLGDTNVIFEMSIDAILTFVR